MVDFWVDALPAAELNWLWGVVGQILVSLAVVDEVLPIRLFLYCLPLSRLLPPFIAVLREALREGCIYVLFCLR